MASPFFQSGTLVTLLQELRVANHAWWQLIVTNAAGTPLVDSGIWNLLYIKGKDGAPTAGEIAAMITKAAAWFADEPADRNTTREYGAHLGQMCMDMDEFFTSEERTAFQTKVNNWCTDCLGNGQPAHGTFSADSDEVKAHRRCVEFGDMYLGDDTYRTMVAGGASSDYSEMVAEEATYFNTKAVGGEYIESGEEYNYGSLQWAVLYAAAQSFTGYAALEAWLPSCALRLQKQLTQDLAECVKWGDTEHQHDHVAARYLPLMCIVIAAGGDADGSLLNYLGHYVQANPPALNSQYDLWRALLAGFDPRDIPASPTALDLDGTDFASGVGHVIRKSGDHHYEFFGSHRVEVHHEWNAQDTRWAITRDGVSEYVLDRIQGYAQSSTCMNTILLAGMAQMHDREITEVVDIAGGCRATWFTDGCRYNTATFFDPPPPFIEFTGTITFHDSGKVTWVDSYDGDWPTRAVDPDNRYLFFNDEDAIATAVAQDKFVSRTVQVPHAAGIPTATAEGYTWTTPLGKTMTLTTDYPNKSVSSLEGGELSGGAYVVTSGNLSLHGYINEPERSGWLIQLWSGETGEQSYTTELQEGEGSPPEGFVSSRSFRQLLRGR
jgi:hypothetical protein